MFVEEAPEVCFNDQIIAIITEPDCYLPIDEKYIEVCEWGSIECICTAAIPVLVGALVEGRCVHVRIPEATSNWPVRVVIRLTGIRRGFAGLRFPDRTKAQFEANERFIKAAYANE
jgi:hypothetical protein